VGNLGAQLHFDGTKIDRFTAGEMPSFYALWQSSTGPLMGVGSQSMIVSSSR
jgi:hypothetical protein